jgi:hypothetical protein
MPLRMSSRALSLQRQHPGKKVQAGRVATPARFDDERHEVRLVAVRLRLLAFIDRCHLACDCVAFADEPGEMTPTSRIQEVGGLPGLAESRPSVPERLGRLTCGRVTRPGHCGPSCVGNTSCSIASRRRGRTRVVVFAILPYSEHVYVYHLSIRTNKLSMKCAQQHH